VVRGGANLEGEDDVGEEGALISVDESASCSLGLSAASQRYFSLRPNQPLAVLFSQNKQHQASATSQTNRL
jgi:hypothetical protein